MNEETPQQNPVEDPTEEQQTNIANQTPDQVPEKKSKKKLIITLVIILLLAAGVAVWYFLLRPTSEPVAKQGATVEEPEVAATKEFKSAELGIGLSYPAVWGEAKLAIGEIYEPGSGSYQQLTFSKQNDVDVNFVLAGFTSPLDGCPDPITVAKHDLSRIKASVIGWQDSNIKEYYREYGSDMNGKTEVNLRSSAKSDSSPGWIKVKSDGKLLIYKDLNQAPVKEIQEGLGSCQDITKAEAEEANTYYNYTHYALNFTKAKIVGVNAQYDTNKGEDAEVVSQLAEILQSIK